MKRSKTRTLRIGSVSTGTMRAEDLIPAFLDAADGLALSKMDRARVKTIRQSFERCGDNGDDYNDSVGAQEDVDELFNILGEHCPPFCYFGAHEGDGADYGCWPSMESLEDAVKAGEVYRVSTSTSGETLSVAGFGGAWRYRMVVSDHGNVTLYHRNGREVWGIV